MRNVTVTLSRFACDALGGEDRNHGVRSEMERAVRCYLSDRGSGRPAWPYPGFLRGSEAARDVALEIEVDDELWRAFEEESGRQGVSVEKLSEHAAVYFVAEVEAGRITQRILDDLGSTEFEDQKA
jgi:hypothetical protein